jgi:hypothetical protein
MFLALVKKKISFACLFFAISKLALAEIKPLIIDGQVVEVQRLFEEFKLGHKKIYHKPTDEDWIRLFRSEIKTSIGAAKYKGSLYTSIRLADDPDYGRYDDLAFLRFGHWQHAEKFLKKFNELYPEK